MIDEIVEYASRYQLVPVVGQSDQFDLVRVKGTVTAVGDDLNKANLLPDVLEEVLGLEQDNPQVKDAFLQLATQGKYVFIVTVKTAQGYPLGGVSVAGVDTPVWGATTTDVNGKLVCLSASATPAVSVALTGYTDVQSYSGSLAAAGEGVVTYADIIIQTNTPTEIVYTASGTVKFACPVLVDVHCISGGGNGGAGHYDESFGVNEYAGAGGVGGGQSFGVNISPTKNAALPIVVGGIGGGVSSALGITANSAIGGGVGALYNSLSDAHYPSSAGSAQTVKKYGTGANITTCSGGGGGIGYSSYVYAASAGGSPYGGAGGAKAANGVAATGTYGNGGGGGGSKSGSDSAGGAGKPGVVYLTWRFAA